MKNKTRKVLTLVLLVVCCLVIFASCSTKRADFFEYSEEDLGLMGKLVLSMHKWIGNYGWTVVVFTVFLKIVMLPLDFWQRYSSRKSSLKMQQMQPIIESIDRRFGANTQRANEEKRKLYNKQGYSMAAMCLPMIISMVIFFIMFGGLRNYSTYSSVRNFQDLSREYYEVYEQEIIGIGGELAGEYQAAFDRVYASAIGESSDSEEVAILKARISGVSAANAFDAEACIPAETAALEAVKTFYESHHESWLWIQNVWQPDTWANIMQPYTGNALAGNGFSTAVDLSTYPGGDKGEAIYNKIRGAVLETGARGDSGKWNGLMILPFMSIGLSFFSMWISQRMERKNRKGETVQAQNQQQAAQNKTMMIIMPLMMAYFGFIYTGAFAIYMVVNYLLSILTTITLRYPVEKLVQKQLVKEEQKNNSNKASYMR